jgi:hypothetical protein
MYMFRVVLMPGGGLLRPCPRLGNALDVLSIFGGTGPSVLPAIPPDPMDKASLWCEECQRFFNPQVDHVCRDRDIKQNRALLEKWLGNYSIQEG